MEFDRREFLAALSSVASTNEKTVPLFEVADSKFMNLHSIPEFTGAIVLPAHFYEFTSANMAAWNAAVAAVKAGTRNARLLVLGDQQVVGAGAGTGGTELTNAKANAWPSQMAPLLNVNAGLQSMIGGQGISTALDGLTSLTHLLSYDPRLAFGAGWRIDGAPEVGGDMVCNGITSPYATTGMSFTPSVNCDTFEIRFATYSTGIVANINLDGGATLASVNCYRTVWYKRLIRQIQKWLHEGLSEPIVTLTGSLGAHTLNIVPANNTGGIWPIHIVVTNSARKEISILNGGWYSSIASELANNYLAPVGYANWLPLEGIRELAPDLTIIMSGSQDAYRETPLAIFISSLQAIITEAQSTGSVILASNAPYGTSLIAISAQQNYVAAMKSLAQSNNIPFVDVFSMMYGGIQSFATSAGFTYLGNASEYNAEGYAKIANWFATALNGFRSLPASLPPVFDAYAYGIGSAVNSLATAGLTTTLANELIYVTVVATGTPSLSISDTAGLTWIPRVANGAGFLYSWYAVAPNTLRSDIITVFQSNGSNIYEVAAVAYARNGVISPLLPQAAVVSANALVSVSTSQASGVILGIYNWSCFGTVGADFTQRYNVKNMMIEDQHFTGPLYNYSVGFTGRFQGSIGEILI